MTVSAVEGFLSTLEVKGMSTMPSRSKSVCIVPDCDDNAIESSASRFREPCLFDDEPDRKEQDVG